MAFKIQISREHTEGDFLFRAAEMKMRLTAPVTSYVEPGSSPFSESTITISLCVPSEQQPDPPRPSESDVFIEDRAGMTVFVR